MALDLEKWALPQRNAAFKLGTDEHRTKKMILKAMAQAFSG